MKSPVVIRDELDFVTRLRQQGAKPHGELSDQEKLIEAHRELNELQDLLRWLAPKIRVRNANGLMMERKCVLCTRTGSERVQSNGMWITRAAPCRHAEIFKYLK